ncbi:universal stress protein [Marinobacter orientalis]|uniref:Universal stress protein n=1 Tax=Marinobacter orientalis TaxID=1928859 RepID=A0A7Y0RE76_9GAMM|nr:universal stress protein [Marinobacter orientalis]NMT64596.1 universal stress protein [Marinobacter orientalis]TGX48367.1 universal stress protein [Marinobacter orientalis]
MLNHLILTVDYTKDWERAMERLPSMIKLLGTRKLTLVHVIETHKRLHTEDDERVVKENLEDLGKKLAGDLDVSTDYRIGKGFVASQVITIAKTIDADGIIVCNRSHSATRELFFGNIALNLARMTRLPLLVIPIDGIPPAVEEEILYATDGSASSLNAQTCFEKLITEGHDGRVLWAKPDDAGAESQEIEERIDSLANKHANVHRHIVTSRAVPAILKAIEEDRPALAVLGKRGATPIEDLPLGSTTEKVAGASSQPVLIIP